MLKHDLKKKLIGLLSVCILSGALVCSTVSADTVGDLTINGEYNTYISVNTDENSLKAIKAGYYAFVYECEGIYYPVIDGAITDRPSTDINSAVVWSEYSEGDDLPAVITNEVLHILFKETETSEVQSFDISRTGQTVAPEERLAPSIESSFVSETKEGITLRVFADAKNSYLSVIELVKVLPNGSYAAYDTVKLYEDRVVTDTVEYTFHENGEYVLYVRSGNNTYWENSYTIEGLESSVSFDGAVEDITAPELTITVDDKAIKAGEAVKITATTNEPCDIVVANMLTDDTTTAVGYAYANGEYEVLATDKSGNTTRKTVIIEAFGEDNGIHKLGNDNPLSNGSSDRNVFWGEVENGKVNGYGYGNKGNSRKSLPQAGLRLWIPVSVSAIAVTATATGFAVKRRRNRKSK